MSLPTSYQDFIHLSRYSRWLDEKGRRETWEETVSRYFDFFIDYLRENENHKITKKEREELEQAVINLDVMPSMRALMTAGEALSKDHVAGYNCAYLSAGRVRSFDEILYILMCGTGVGFSVERGFLEKLATIAEEFEDSDTPIRTLLEENSLPSNVTISSVKLQKLLSSGEYEEAPLLVYPRSRTKECEKQKQVSGGTKTHKEH